MTNTEARSIGLSDASQRWAVMAVLFAALGGLADAPVELALAGSAAMLLLSINSGGDSA